MLPGVTRKDQSATVRSRQGHQFPQLLAADLAGLIHEHHCTRWQRFRFEAVRERFGRKAVGIEIGDLLALRRSLERLPTVARAMSVATRSRRPSRAGVGARTATAAFCTSAATCGIKRSESRPPRI